MKTRIAAVALWLSIISMPGICEDLPVNQTLSFPTSLSCLDSPTAQSSQVLLILDRTTALNSDAQQRWTEGIAKIFSSPTVVGGLQVLELRDAVSDFHQLGSGCLEDFRPLDAQKKDFSIYQKLVHWVVHLFEPEPDLIFEHQRAAEDRRLRIAYAKQISALVKFDVHTRSDTEISQSLVSSIQTFCSGRLSCFIYICSDLLDSKAKASLNAPDFEVKEAGSKRAKELISEFHPDVRNTELRVRSWGFGRSDIASGVSLSESDRRKLRLYWEEFFTELGKYTKNYSYKITDFLNDP